MSAGRKSGLGDIVGGDHRRRVCDRGDQPDPARLGAGFGFASVSPWSNSGASATTFGVAAAVWLIVVQWLSAAFGGYLTGRLRTKWVSVHSDEIYFRDTAHGFLAWAVAAVITAAVLASAAVVGDRRGGPSGRSGRCVGGAGRAAGAAAAARPRQPLDPTAIWSPSCSAPTTRMSNANPQPARAEATPIIVRGLSTGDVPAADRSYLTGLVVARTGLSQPDATRQVDDVIAQTKSRPT